MTAASRALLAIALLGGVAQAEPSAADKAFKHGRELFKAAKYVEACAEFEKSQQLDPEMGTLFNLAQCDEKVGKLASAIEAYRKIVADDTNAKRKSTAAEYAVKLGLRVPKLVVQVVSPPATLQIALTGPSGTRPITGNEPVEVDQGDYLIVVKADGYRELSLTAKITAERKTVTVPAPLEHVLVEAPVVEHPVVVPPPVVHDEPPPTVSHRKAGIALAVGGAALAGGLVVGLLTRNKWNDAQAVCGGTSCPTQAQANQANDIANQAHSLGTISSALVIGGGVVMAVGGVLWITASPERAVRVSASAGSSSAGFVVSGWF
jgi:hypothetical protein